MLLDNLLGIAGLLHSRRWRQRFMWVAISLACVLVIWQLFDWLTQPTTLIALFLLVLTLLPFIKPARSWQHYVLKGVTGLLLAYLVVTSPPAVRLANYGLTAVLSPDSGETVDSIIVLGRGEPRRNERIAEAIQLWKDDRAPHIFVSGMSDAQEIVDLLHESGIPRSALSGERCSQSTEENGLFTAAVLYPQGVRRVLLVTDSPHMLRSLLVFRSVGFEVIPHAIPQGGDLTFEPHMLSALREYAGLIGYWISGRFQPHSIEQLSRPPSAVIHKMTDWNCRINDSETPSDVSARGE
ncbi:MAG: YdcF family protein [Elainellaceae cyanobacterium]